MKGPSNQQAQQVRPGGPPDSPAGDRSPPADVASASASRPGRTSPTGTGCNCRAPRRAGTNDWSRRRRPRREGGVEGTRARALHGRRTAVGPDALAVGPEAFGRRIGAGSRASLKISRRRVPRSATMWGHYLSRLSARVGIRPAPRSARPACVRICGARAPATRNSASSVSATADATS